MTAKEILIAARKLIEKPENWCRDSFALDPDGQEVHCTSPRACAFCVRGAISAVDRPPYPFHTQDATSLIEAEVPEGADSLCHFNDEIATHPDILALFDRAIARAS